MVESRCIRKGVAGRRPKSGKADGDTRAEILSAARCVFARRGLDGASVREVAKTAKVNNAMIYYHFTDKVELYRAVLSDSFAALDRIWDHPAFNTPASSHVKIRKYVEEMVRFQHANEELRRILSMEFASCGRNFKWLGENLFNHSYRKLAGILNEGMKKGELKKVQPSHAIAALVGIIIHSFILQPVSEYVSGKKMNLNVRQFSNFVTELFFNGLEAENSASTINKPGKVNTRTVQI